jgi:hypothetical protein
MIGTRGFVLTICILGAFTSLAALAHAVLPQPVPIAKFTATGLRANEHLGYSVATDGQRVLFGTGGGSAFLYDPYTQQQLAKITLPETRFGTSVALQGNAAVIGTRGSAYVYNLANIANITRTTLTPTDATAAVLGPCVDLSGDTIIVGAQSSGPNFEGAAYLFDRITGAQIAKLSPNVSAPFANFGLSVALDGNLAVIGATPAFIDGSVYLFDGGRNVVGNRQLDRFTVPGALNLGLDVEISGDTIMSIDGIGNTYFWPTSGDPVALPLRTTGRGSGDALNFNDGYAAVAFPNESGVAIYNSAGALLRFLSAPAGSPAGFGNSVALAGDLVVVGAPGGGNAALGAGYVYRVQDIISIPEPTTLLSAFAACMLTTTHRRSKGCRTA